MSAVSSSRTRPTCERTKNVGGVEFTDKIDVYAQHSDGLLRVGLVTRCRVAVAESDRPDHTNRYVFSPGQQSPSGVART
jgi:hypothetical protein